MSGRRRGGGGLRRARKGGSSRWRRRKRERSRSGSSRRRCRGAMPSWLRTRFDDTAAGGDHATRERRARGPGHAIAEEEEQLRSAGHPPSMHPASCGGSRGIRPSVPPPTTAHRRRDATGSVRAADAIDGVEDEGRSSKRINPRRPYTDPPHHRREGRGGWPSLDAGGPRRRQYRKEGRGQCRRWGGGRAAGGVAAGEVHSVKNTKGTGD